MTGLPVRRRIAAPLVAVVMLSWITAACADPEDSSLCTSFDSLVASGQAIRATDAGTLTAGDATALADAYLQRVTQLQEVADGRYTAELDALEQAADDLVLTLASVQDDADSDTWEPLVEDTLDDLSDAASRAEQAIEPSCSPDVSAES